MAIHAALLAQRIGKPVRMIYDRHEDIASTTKRHPAIDPLPLGRLRRWPARRPGHRGHHGRRRVLHADAGGAVARRAPRRRPVRVPQRPHPRAARWPPTRRPTAPSVASGRRRSASPTSCRWRASPMSWASPRPSCASAGSTARAASTPSGQVLRESVAAAEVLRAGHRGGRLRGRPRGQPADARHPLGPGRRGRVGLQLHARPLRVRASAWPWAGTAPASPVGARSCWPASPAWSSGDDGVVRILVANTEIGQGTNTVMPMIVAEALGIDAVRGRDGAHRHLDRAQQRPHGRLAHGDGRGRPGHQGRAAACARWSRRAPAGRSPTSTGPMPGPTVPPASTSSSSRVTDVDFDEETHTGDAYPAFGWACAVAKVDVDLDTGEVRVRSVVSADDVGRVIHPLLAEGQVEGGTLQSVGYGTIEEMKLKDGRYLNDRLSTYIIPTSMDAPRDHGHPRGEAVQRRTARRQGRRRAAHERGRAGHRRRHPRRGRGLDRPSCRPPPSACSRPWRSGHDRRSRARRWAGHAPIGSRSTASRARSRCRACGACSTSSARTSA